MEPALSDKPELIRRKTQSMFTDPLRIKFSDPGHPEKCNVHSYYAIFAPEDKIKLEGLCRSSQIGCTECKKALAEILIRFLEPIQKKKNKLVKNKKQIFEILDQGRQKAQGIASETMGEVKNLLSLNSCE